LNFDVPLHSLPLHSAEIKPSVSYLLLQNRGSALRSHHYMPCISFVCSSNFRPRRKAWASAVVALSAWSMGRAMQALDTDCDTLVVSTNLETKTRDGDFMKDGEDT
jgi:hypothetical protein